MPLTFAVEIVSADHKVYSGQSVSLIMPGVDGYFGVLSGHAPLIAALGIGMITLQPPGGELPILFAVAGGFAEVTQDQVTVLAETAEQAQEIDVERARLAAERARTRLAEAAGKRETTDIDRARAALMRALNRLRVAEYRQMGR